MKSAVKNQSRKMTTEYRRLWMVRLNNADDEYHPWFRAVVEVPVKLNAGQADLSREIEKVEDAVKRSGQLPEECAFSGLSSFVLKPGWKLVSEVMEFAEVAPGVRVFTEP